MKPTDKPTDPHNPMVARTEPARTPFTVQKPETPAPSAEAERLLQEVQAEQAELEAVEEGLAGRRAQLLEKAQQAQEAARQTKLAEWRQKAQDAADYAEMAKTAADPAKGKEFYRLAKDAQAVANRLAAELELTLPDTAAIPEPPTLRPFSTNKAIQLIVGLFVAFVLLTYWFGAPLEADPMNAIGQSMMKNAPIRALLSFTLTFLTFLVAVFFIRVAFPPFYRIWHNRIDSERTLDSLLNEAPAWAVLLSLLGLFFTFMQLFASFYQALYA